LARWDGVPRWHHWGCVDAQGKPSTIWRRVISVTNVGLEYTLSTENVNKIIRLIDKEIKLLLENGISDEEFKRAKNKYVSELYSYVETSFGQNEFLSESLFGNLPLFSDLISMVNNLTKKEIIEVCKNIFSRGNRKVFTYIPRK